MILLIFWSSGSVPGTLTRSRRGREGWHVRRSDYIMRELYTRMACEAVGSPGNLVDGVDGVDGGF